MAKFKVPVTCVAVVTGTVDVDIPDDVLEDWPADEWPRLASSHVSDLVAANDWPVAWAVKDVDLDQLVVGEAKKDDS